MNVERLTVKSREVLQRGVALAAARGNPDIDSLHLLHALLDESEGAVQPTLLRLGATPSQLRDAVTTALDTLPAARGTTTQQPGMNRRLSSTLDRAEQRAGELGDEYTSTEHLLLALADDDGPAGSVLRQAGVDGDQLLAALRESIDRCASRYTRGDGAGPEGQRACHLDANRYLVESIC
jgi:ATP-dependent Clp protease ATP-binding subunit ClpB